MFHSFVTVNMWIKCVCTKLPRKVLHSLDGVCLACSHISKIICSCLIVTQYGEIVRCLENKGKREKITITVNLYCGFTKHDIMHKLNANRIIKKLLPRLALFKLLYLYHFFPCNSLNKIK